MPELLSFFTIILAGLFFSHIFNRLHLPWVVALIIAGIVIGPAGFNVYQPDPTFELLGEIGLIFLMFMAGLETRFTSFDEIKHDVLPIFLLNSIIPFVTGFSLSMYFGFELIESILLGIIVTSASIAVIVPSLEKASLLKTKLGQSIIVTAILEDIFSLVLLSIVLQFSGIVNAISIPLPLFYLLLVALFISLKYLLPQIRDHLSWIHKRQKDAYEHELRLVFVILIGTVLLFELIGLEAIIAGFFTGITLSTSIKSEALKNKLHAISYGFFIPIFFVTIGTKTDLMPIFNDGTILVLTITIITVSLFAKFITGWVGGKLSNFSQKESVFIGVATTPHLSTALAVAFTGHAFDLVDDRMFALMIALTLVSTLIGPLLINYAAKKL